MPIDLKHVDPQEKDGLSIQLNQADMEFEKGFGRRYVFSASLSLFKSALTGLSIMQHFVKIKVTDDFNSNKNGFSWEIFQRSAAIMAKGLILGTIKLIGSIAIDPFKIAIEAYEKRRCRKGRTALLIVDAQKDFTKAGIQVVDDVEYVYDEGNLGVSQGYEIVPVINRLIDRLPKDHYIVASLDWHPKGHRSFASSTPGTLPFVDKILLSNIEQTVWPDHCIQGTEGAQFLPGLKTKGIQYIVKKGLALFVDSYSAFFDNGRKNKTALDEYLKGQNVKRIILTGIATDYCVKYTALDAMRLGFDVTLAIDACRGVDPDLSEKAIEELRRKGARIMTSAEILVPFNKSF